MAHTPSKSLRSIHQHVIQRLRQALKEAGVSGVEFGALFVGKNANERNKRVTASNILNLKRQIKIEEWSKIAALTGKPIAWFFNPSEKDVAKDDVLDQLSALLRRLDRPKGRSVVADRLDAKKVTAAQLIKKAQELTAQGVHWHHHYLPPTCSLNRGKDYLLHLEDNAGHSWQATSSKRPAELETLEELDGRQRK